MSRSRIYRVKFGKRYRKDIKRLAKANVTFEPLEQIIEKLSRDEKLPESCKDHALKGRLKRLRECHIKSDWLLLYSKDKTELVLILISTGDHRRVLGME